MFRKTVACAVSVCVLQILCLGVIAQAQDDSPLSVQYACSVYDRENSMHQTESGTLQEQGCFPPNQYRDSYLCYYGTGLFSSEFGFGEVGMSLLLSKRQFSSLSRKKKVCLRSVRVAYSGDTTGPFPFVSSGSISDLNSAIGNSYIRECATFVRFEKTFSAQSTIYSHAESGEIDGVACDLTIGPK